MLFSWLIISMQSFSQDSLRHFRFAKSVGKLPFLCYSLGEDRLGNAKLGYIDTSVVLRVEDSVKEQYLIRLSKYHTAYMAKADVQFDSAYTPKPFYLVNNWRAEGGTGNYDTLSINMDERLPYKSWMEINPSRIMLEIYGVQSNTNWITQLSSLKEIKNLYYNQTEDDVVQVTMELQHKQHWGYTIGYDSTRLRVLVKRQPDTLELQHLVIGIDAGHGGSNIGAEGITSHIAEKNYTIIFAKALEKYLNKNGIQTIMTRDIDTTIGNTDRMLALQQQKPDILISLHLNSSNDTAINGTATFYKYIGFRPLSVSLLEQMKAAGMNEYGNVGNFNFLLNTPTDFPNALLEIAFLSNKNDEQKILDPSFPSLVAQQVYLALNDFLKQAK